MRSPPRVPPPAASLEAWRARLTAAGFRVLDAAHDEPEIPPAILASLPHRYV